MTSNNDDRKITISFEVTIPFDRQIDASEVAVRGSTSKGCAKSQDPKMVQGPQTGQEWKVKIYGSGPGVICAYGDGHEDADRVSISAGATLDEQYPGNRPWQSDGYDF